MSDENKIKVKYALSVNGIDRYITPEGYVYGDYGGLVFCTKCCNEKNLDSSDEHDAEQLTRLKAYFMEDEEYVSVKCQRCGRVVIDDYKKIEMEFDKLKQKKMEF